ncbi:hypothetical protein RFI_01515 [Reticulomyxa filosa]|uniref:Uncharacterized protein n=1 Tax=Reticulomyxa filosa TaxID=46433 RepID=X6PAJ0_RETFI|nr:hypothetical protein RFI_01515 [Reticulomyxa filosa]|eukprot:ETO35550.1 hypothetical protein RFI_01515 [Reticulomyxa filosa]
MEISNWKSKNLFNYQLKMRYPVKDDNYQCPYSIKSGLSYELKANKIKQFREYRRFENAMYSIEIKNLVIELQKYEVKVAKTTKLLERIQADYDSNLNQVFNYWKMYYFM